MIWQIGSDATPAPPSRMEAGTMRSSDWQPMETAPLNPYGQAYGPTVLIWCRADATPWPAYYSPWHGWEQRDCGPAWVIPDQEPAIAPEDAVAWMPIAAPWSEAGGAGVKQSLTTWT